jgi:hypothetical protein
MGKIANHVKSRRLNAKKGSQLIAIKKSSLVAHNLTEIVVNNKSDPNFVFVEKEIYEMNEVGSDLISDIIEFILDNGASHRTIGVLTLAILKYIKKLLILNNF